MNLERRAETKPSFNPQQYTRTPSSSRTLLAVRKKRTHSVSARPYTAMVSNFAKTVLAEIPSISLIADGRVVHCDPGFSGQHGCERPTIRKIPAADNHTLHRLQEGKAVHMKAEASSKILNTTSPSSIYTSRHRNAQRCINSLPNSRTMCLRWLPHSINAFRHGVQMRGRKPSTHPGFQFGACEALNPEKPIGSNRSPTLRFRSSAVFSASRSRYLGSRTKAGSPTSGFRP
jgi:hypothetical protein